MISKTELKIWYASYKIIPCRRHTVTIGVFNYIIWIQRYNAYVTYLSNSHNRYLQYCFHIPFNKSNNKIKCK